MHCLLLVQETMEPIPANITVKNDWGQISIVADGTPVRGRHVLVECTEEDLKAWLKPFDGVWIGHGAAMFQQFTLVHVKE